MAKTIEIRQASQPVVHPLPWRWDEQEEAIYDARGNLVFDIAIPRPDGVALCLAVNAQLEHDAQVRNDVLEKAAERFDDNSYSELMSGRDVAAAIRALKTRNKKKNATFISCVNLS